ncbi:MAG: amidohydrolase [Cyclobacteriaceae bacterium]
MQEKIKELAAKYWPSCVDVRRYLHQHPELSFQEKNTSAYLERELKRLSPDQLQRIDDNGLLATIRGNAPGKTLVLRADMDALPIVETNTHDFVSKKPGVMHACGHDAHSAMLLTAAKILNETKMDWSGEVRLLFQPAEEKIPGGATLMIAGGVLREPVPAGVVGQHVMPALKSGQVGIRAGKFMASSDEIFITFKGKGGHGAMPENCIDPVLMAGNFLLAVQQIVSRRSSPKMPSVVSFGKIVGMGATNVIPDEVSLEGTLRTLDEDWREEALRLIEKMANNLAESMGGTCEVTINHGYPHLYNDPALASRLKSHLEEYVSAENVIEQDIWMAAEDFAYYSQQVPSCFYLLGTQGTNGLYQSGLHTPTFDIDEKAMELGSGLMAFLAIKELEG